MENLKSKRSLKKSRKNLSKRKRNIWQSKCLLSHIRIMNIMIFIVL